MGDSTWVLRWVLVGSALVAFKFALDKVLLVQKAFASIKSYPGRTVSWINPFGAVSFVLGTRYPRPGMTGCLTGKFSLYRTFGATSFTSILISTAQQCLWTADSEAIKLITSDRHTFQKHVFVRNFFDLYGATLASAEGSEWRRHKSIARSAFNEANVALIWSEVLRTMTEWFEELDGAGSNVTVDTLHSMKKAIFLVVCAAAFGKPMSWSSDSTGELPPGCKLTFQSALLGSANNIVVKMLIPKWFYRLSSSIKVPYLSSRALFIQLAFDDLRSHLLDLVASARADIVSGKPSGTSGAALLRNLVEANMTQEGESEKLTEGEVLSNIFLFLVAGHETSAHTLSFAFALLALYPDAQQKLYEEVTHIWPEDVPVSQLMTDHRPYMDRFEYTLAFIRETLRMFPVINRLFKEAHANAVLPSTYFSPGPQGSPPIGTGKFSVVVPAGSFLVVDIWALHMNPVRWGEDVAEFKPERFIDTESYRWPRDAYMPFSAGARSCIGERFAFAEMFGILASVVRRYQIRVPDDLAEKPWEEQKATLLDWKLGITLMPTNPNVRFCRRA